MYVYLHIIYTCVCICVYVYMYRRKPSSKCERPCIVCDTTHSYVTCLIRICIHVTWLMHMPRSTSERDTTDVYGTWLIHTRLDGVRHMNESRASHVTLAHVNDRQVRGEHSTADEWVQRARGGSTRDRRGSRRAQDLNTLWCLGFMFIRAGLVDGNWWVSRERGEQYGVATMSRPDQWWGLFWRKEPYTNRALSQERAGHLN